MKRRTIERLVLLLMVKQVQPIAAGRRGYSRSFAGIFHITLLC